MLSVDGSTGSASTNQTATFGCTQALAVPAKGSSIHKNPEGLGTPTPKDHGSLASSRRPRSPPGMSRPGAGAGTAFAFLGGGAPKDWTAAGLGVRAGAGQRASAQRCRDFGRRAPDLARAIAQRKDELANSLDLLPQNFGHTKNEVESRDRSAGIGACRPHIDQEEGGFCECRSC